jgi:hypothetical protein
VQVSHLPFTVACSRRALDLAKPNGTSGGGDGEEGEGEGESKPSKSGKRVKFTCPSCEANAWGKETLKLICGDCRKPFEAA